MASYEGLIEQLKSKRLSFAKGVRPLMPKETRLLDSWLRVLRETDHSRTQRSRSNRSIVTQAHYIIGLIASEIGLQVFILFILTISVTKLVEIKSETLIPDVRSWWRACSISAGLQQAANKICEYNSISTLIAFPNNGENGPLPSETNPQLNNALSRPAQQQHDAMQDVQHIALTQAPQVWQYGATNEILDRQESSRQPLQMSAASESAANTQMALRGAAINGKITAYETELQDRALYSFLASHRGKYPKLAILVPVDDNVLPSIQISREMCQELIQWSLQGLGRM